jgi:hypothetical protein
MLEVKDASDQQGALVFTFLHEDDLPSDPLPVDRSSPMSLMAGDIGLGYLLLLF